MAYDPNQDPQNQQNQTQNPAIQPMTSSAPGAGPGASTGKAATPQSAPAQPFQNLQAYLTANAPQVQTQANQIAGNLNNQYGQVQGDINKAQSDFGEQVKGGYAQANQDLTNEAAANPSAFVSNPGNVKAFQSLYNDTYAGPSSFESGDQYGNLSNEVQNAASNATAFTSLPGIQNYFQGQNQNATQGGNTLDAILLSGNPNAYKTIQNAANPFSNLNDYLSNAATSSNKGVSKAQQDASNISAGVQNQFAGQDGIIPKFKKYLNDQYTSGIGKDQQMLDQLTNNLSHGDISPKDAQALGLDPAEVQKFVQNYAQVQEAGGAPNFDATSYVTNNIGGLGPQSFATKQDYDNAIALNKLTGVDMGYLNSANAPLAGSSNNPFSFNIGNANKSLADLLQVSPVAPGTSPIPTQPTDLVGQDVRNAIGGTPSNIINKNTNTFLDVLNPGIGLPSTIGDNVASGISKIPGDIANPLLNPASTIKGIDNFFSDPGKSLGIDTSNLNPFGSNAAATNERDQDEHQQDQFFGSLADKFNGMLPDQYKINPTAISQSNDPLSAIPPKGAIPDILRDNMLFSVLSFFPGSSGGLINQSPEMQADAAESIRSNISQANQEQKNFLNQYDQSNPQTSITRQDVINDIDNTSNTGGFRRNGNGIF